MTVALGAGAESVIATAGRAKGSNSRSPLWAHTAWLLALMAAEPDLTLAATVDRMLSAREVKTQGIELM